MNLNFKTHFPWPGADGKPEPTYFKARILAGLTQRRGDAENAAVPKLHTIRRLKNGKARFREGMKLTFSTGSRFKPERFGEMVCTGVQRLQMEPRPSYHGVNLLIHLDLGAPPMHLLSADELQTLAENDGLKPYDFMRWFTMDAIQNGPGVYELVHWTDVRY